MRIAVITSSYPRFEGDGTAPFVKSLTEALVARGHGLVVLAPFDNEVDDKYDQGIQLIRFKYIFSMKLHILGHARSLEGDARLKPLAVILLPLYLLAARRNLLRITHKQSTQVIHAHWLLPNGLVAAWVAQIRKIPFIVSLHGSDMFVAGKNFIYRAVARYILKRASAISACSQELMDRAIELGAGNKVKLIPWGADPQLFHPIENKQDVRKQFGWSDKDFIVCSLGRMVEKKGFNILVKAFAGFCKESQRDNVQLVIGGEGPEREKLSELARHLGVEDRLHLPGVINWDDVPRFLGGADAFVLPSVRDIHGNLDGLPTVLLEAMGCGLPCIASNIGGVSLVIRDGENGILVEPGNVQELQEAISKTITETGYAVQLGKTARDDVVRQFNWKQVAMEFEKMISRISHPQKHIRLGQSYRNAMLPLLVKLPSVECALDLGCHDGSWLENVSANFKVGVDMDPVSRYRGIEMVKADVTRLPFKADAFGLVSSLDVLEHLEEPALGVDEIARVLENNGLMLLTTPSDQIRLFPRCLTGMISKGWGHNLRKGYSIQELENLFREKMVTTIKPWQAKTYRLYYLGLRALYWFNEHLALSLLKRVVMHDLQNPWGDHGYWLVTGYKKEML
jgi:glycosyltransferase involved in cell wall biosynthesis/2-polyprenyl-3-methyl-5-hydroxy-6-metoxy-1,4-benzoquinol methylase